MAASSPLPLSTFLVAVIIPPLLLLLALTVVLVLYCRLHRRTKEHERNRVSAPFVWVPPSPELLDRVVNPLPHGPPYSGDPSPSRGAKAREAATVHDGRWSSEEDRGSFFEGEAEADRQRQSSELGHLGGSGSEVSQVTSSEVERLSGEYVEATLVRFRTASSETMRIAPNGPLAPPPAQTQIQHQLNCVQPPPLQVFTTALGTTAAVRPRTPEEELPPRPTGPTPRGSPPRLRTRPSLSPTTSSPLKTIYELPPIFTTPTASPSAPQFLHHSSGSSLSLRSSAGPGAEARSSMESIASSSSHETAATLGPSEYWTAPGSSSYVSRASPTSAAGQVPFPTSGLGAAFKPLESPTLARASPAALHSPNTSPRTSLAIPPTPKLHPVQSHSSVSPVSTSSAPSNASGATALSPARKPVAVHGCSPGPTTVLVRERSSSGERQLWRISSANSLRNAQWTYHTPADGGVDRPRPGSV